MARASETVVEPGWGTLELFPLETSEAALLDLLRHVFEDYWRQIRFGPLIQGAAWEIRAPSAPTGISLLDGYVTIDFGAWHFHLCIGPHEGSAANPTDPDLARHRRTARAELYRQLKADGSPNSWGLRLLNGAGEQQITVFLPSPFLSDELKCWLTPTETVRVYKALHDAMSRRVASWL